MNINSKPPINKQSLNNPLQNQNINNSSKVIQSVNNIVPNSNTISANKSTRAKPLSMNDSMLAHILREPNKRQTLVKTKPNFKLDLSIDKGGKSISKEPMNNSIITENNPTEMSINQNSIITTSMKSIKLNRPHENLNNRINKERTVSKAKSKVSFANKKCVITLNHEIPLPTNKHLQKNPSNGSSLEATTNHSHTSTDRDIFLSTSSNLKSFNTLDSYKLTEEMLEYKLSNSKLKNEISILNEKIKTIKQVILMKTDENEMIKSNYSEIIEEYKKESEKARKLHSEFNSMRETINKQSFHLNSIISIMTDLIEIFISSRSPYVFGNSHIMTRQSITTNNENISATDIDVYYSYNNDDDRRNTLIEQIQALLVAKLSVIKKTLPNMDIDKEIERIKSWNFFRNPNESEINISNLRLSKNIIEESCSESFRKNCSNDFFDLSISNQIMSQSPKFNSAANSVYSVSAGGFNKDLSGTKERSSINNNEKNGDNFLLNDSFLKDLKQNESFSEEKTQSGHNVSIIDNQLNMNEIKDKENVDINITDCSVIDINMENKSKEAKMLFNDDPTEFNIEFNVIPNMIAGDEQINSNFYNTFQNQNEIENFNKPNNEEEEPPTPIILNPIVNTNPTLNLSFNK